MAVVPAAWGHFPRQRLAKYFPARFHSGLPPCFGVVVDVIILHLGNETYKDRRDFVPFLTGSVSPPVSRSAVSPPVPRSAALGVLSASITP